MNSSYPGIFPQNTTPDSLSSVPPSCPTRQRFHLRTALQTLGGKLWNGRELWNGLVNGSDIRVTRNPLANGEMRWNGYDPQGDRHIYQATEAELRAWIEQRYR